MKSAEETMNNFLVCVFNDILRLEENNIQQHGCRALSVSELHVLEQIQRLDDGGAGAGMGHVAKALEVTNGTLSIAIKTLEQKGFVKRRKDAADKRRVYLQLCDSAYLPLSEHKAFHARLVEHACCRLSEQELISLASALESLHKLFTQGQGDAGVAN